MYWCPRCNGTFFISPCVSRKDQHTRICSDCALIEDLEAAGMKAPYHGRKYWTVVYHTGDGMAGPAPKSG